MRNKAIIRRKPNQQFPNCVSRGSGQGPEVCVAGGFALSNLGRVIMQL